MMNRIFAFATITIIFTAMAGIAQTEQNTTAAEREAAVEALCEDVSRATCLRWKGAIPSRIDVSSQTMESLGY